MLCAPREDRHQQIPGGPARVQPALTNRDDLDADAIQLQDVGQVPDHGAPESVERPDDEDLEGALSRGAQHGLVLRPTLDSAGRLLERRNNVESTRSGELLAPMRIG